MESIGAEEEGSHIIDICHFDLMMSWEAKAISGSTTYPFVEETDHSKIPQVLLGKLAHLKINFENNMPGTTKKMEK